MDEEVSIINTKTRNEKIKNFFVENKKILLAIIVFIILFFITLFSYQIYKDNRLKSISEKYHSAVIEYTNGDKTNVVSSMKHIVEDQDSTYSPLALYFLIDNNLLEKKEEANLLFDILIQKTKLEKEINYLIIYKKALYNVDTSSENELLDILKPIINSKSIWKPHALYLIAEFFYSKKEKQKAKEFYNQILITEKVNQDLIQEAQKRLNRDLSE